VENIVILKKLHIRIYGVLPAGKEAVGEGGEAVESYPSNAKTKNDWIYTLTFIALGEARIKLPQCTQWSHVGE